MINAWNVERYYDNVAPINRISHLEFAGQGSIIQLEEFDRNELGHQANCKTRLISDDTRLGGLLLGFPAGD